MYKAGDLVRIINDGYYFKKGEIYTIKEINQSGTILFFYDWGVESNNVEPVTHLTTKEFIKLVEDMGYELDIRTGVIFIKTKNFREVGWVRTDYECSAAFNFECDKLLLDIFYLYANTRLELRKLDIFYLYANTPLELRKEKEQLYTLELPNNNKKYKYYQHMYKDKRHYIFGKLRQSDTWKCYFTKKEIENLDNQELIKMLKQEPVKENEQ